MPHARLGPSASTVEIGVARDRLFQCRENVNLCAAPGTALLGMFPAVVSKGRSMERRFTFDKIANLYDAARPSYPDALLNDVVAFAGLKPGDPVLEIGCGTGKATAGFALRGLDVVALDPGADLLRVARKNLTGFQNIQLLQTTFEAWPPQPGAFRLVVAAQSWHWITPEVRITKVAEVLTPGGSLAVFGNEAVGLASSLLDAFKRIYAHYVPSLWEQVAAETWYLPSGPVAKLIGGSRLFAAVTHKSYPWSGRTPGQVSLTSCVRSRTINSWRRSNAKCCLQPLPELSLRMEVSSNLLMKSISTRRSVRPKGQDIVVACAVTVIDAGLNYDVAHRSA
jgi:ubiquinone/menaquinone biosynthesis C-methylase UbiE